MQLADFNPIPLIVIGVIWSLINSSKKKAKPPSSTLFTPTPDRPAAGGLMGELSRALEELKRAEAEARSGQHTALMPPPAKPSMSDDTARAYLREKQARSDARQAGGRHTDAPMVKRQVFVPKPRPEPKPKRPSVRMPSEDDMSSEDPTVISLEGQDYDDEAEKIIAARRKQAERVVRRDESSEDLSALQIARRGDRKAEAIGGKVEHETWHQRRDAALAAEAAALSATHRPRANPLARYATGKVRDAIVLSEILGRPLGER